MKLEEIGQREQKQRIVQELVPGKQITLAHIIANPDGELYEKLGLDPRVELSRAAIGIMTVSPSETAIIMADIARFADGLPGVHRIHLLPYHRLGQDKYEGLGREYLMKDILPPTAEHMEMLKRTVERVSGLECRIGG